VLLVPEVVALDATGADAAAGVVERVWVDRLLAQLPEEQSRLLRSAYVDDRPLEDLAALAGCSIAALRVRLHRARRTAARSLDEAPHKECSCNGSVLGGNVRDEAPHPLSVPEQGVIMNALSHTDGLRRAVVMAAAIAVATFGMVVVQAESADAVTRSGYKVCTPAGRAVQVKSNARYDVTHYYRGAFIGAWYNPNYQTRNGYGTSSGGQDLWTVSANNGILSASATCSTT